MKKTTKTFLWVGGILTVLIIVSIVSTEIKLRNEGWTAPETIKPVVVEKSPVKEKSKSTKSQSSDINSDFTYAVEGESWMILDNNVALTSQPKTYSDRDEFERDLVTILNYGDKVEIIKMKVVGRWKYCKVKGNLYGWVSANNVNKARLIL